jgi:hypothetical protein
MTTIISLDCEANGLHGDIFAAAAAVFKDGREVSHWHARCPIVEPVDPWVAANVLPALTDMPVSVSDYDRILAEWVQIFTAHDRESTRVIAHVPWPVEARFLWDAHRGEPFSGPFPLIDVASMMHAHRIDPLSVDAYLTDQKIPLPPGSPHHPLYDCRAAAYAYFDVAGIR